MAFVELLKSPRLYQLFQELGGFFGARVKAIDQYLKLEDGHRVVDIGCGPGFMRAHLPDAIQYIGYDLDQAYIDYANARFGNKGAFYCRPFNREAVSEIGQADVVMMNGVLHHIPDLELKELLGCVRDVLTPTGALFTLDGVFIDQQSWLVRKLLENDRGKHVRTPTGYEKLLRSSFDDVSCYIRSDISYVPYTFFVTVSRKYGPLGASC